VRYSIDKAYRITGKNVYVLCNAGVLVVLNFEDEHEDDDEDEG
jgi:hypothetical protein